MRDADARPRKRRRPPARRKTVRWSASEVDALLAGVRLHGVGKWAAILRHSKVFNGVRTSVDLKDKWRNLTSPVRAAALALPLHPAPPQPPPDRPDHPTLPTLRAHSHGSPVPSSSPDDDDNDDESDDDHDELMPPQQDGDPDEAHDDDDDDKPNSSHDHSSPHRDHFDHSPDHSPDHSHPDDASAAPSDHPHQPSPSHPPAPGTPSASNSHSHSHSLSHSPVRSLSHSLSHTHSLTNTPTHTPSIPPVAALSRPSHQASHPPPLHHPPPSESSVSPDVLSTPSAPAPAPHPSATAPVHHHHPYAHRRLPHPHPHPHPQALQPHHAPHQPQPQAPFPYHDPNNPVMQQAFGQSLYHSATAIAEYYRRIGQDPTPYNIAAALSASTGSAHFNPYYATNGASSLYHGVNDDDDDDDDDDEDIQQITPPYALSFAPGFNRSAVHMPLSNHAVPSTYHHPTPAHPSLLMPYVPMPPTAPNSASQNNARPRTSGGEVSQAKTAGSQPTASTLAGCVAATSNPPKVPSVVDSGDVEDEASSGAPTSSARADARCHAVRQPEPKTVNRSESIQSKDVGRLEIGSHPEAGSRDNGEGLPCASSAELEYFSVGEFPEKKGPEEEDDDDQKEEEGDDDIIDNVDGENIVGNAWSLVPRVFGPQNNDNHRAFSATDLD